MLNLPVPWGLLLTTLRHGDSSVVSYAAVSEAGSDGDTLVRQGLAELGGADGYASPHCRHGVLPTLDFQRRYAESLVGVACPGVPACWPGWIWVPRAEVTVLRPRTGRVLSALAHRNGLLPIRTAVPPPFAAVGLLQQRGLAVPVVWLRDLPQGFELLCKALRQHLGDDGLIVLVATAPRFRFEAAEQICLVEMGCRADGDLRLTRALDELCPGYREQALSDPTLDFDHIHLRLDSHAGVRHVVQINGIDAGGFRRSDVKFLRLLLLAVARQCGANDGWVPKHVLCGDDPKDHGIERLRNELGRYHVPALGEGELRALVRCQRGCVRLALPPKNIQVDLALAELAFVGAAAANATQRQRAGLRNAEALLRACQDLVAS